MIYRHSQNAARLNANDLKDQCKARFSDYHRRDKRIPNTPQTPKNPKTKNNTDPACCFAPLDLKMAARDGSFEGYASLFGKADMGRDVVMAGAFSQSLKKRGSFGIKMLFQHDPAQIIGVWQDIHEDRRGLYVRGQLMLDLAKGRDMLALMRAGALEGLSIGFRVLKARQDRAAGVRRLFAVDLWEISVVTFPMQPEAKITAVKAQTAAAERKDYPQAYLLNKIGQAAQGLRGW